MRTSAPASGAEQRDGRPAWTAADDRVAQALFAEARRRRLRIRLAGSAAIVVGLLAAALGVGWPGLWPGHSGGGSVPPGGSAQTQAAAAPRLAWVDASDQLVLGNLATFTKRVVAQVDADPAAPIVPFRGAIYWVKFSGGYTDGAFWPRVVEKLNPATGASTIVGPGEFLFPSADGRQLYISQTDNALAEVAAGALGTAREHALPDGWYLPGGFSVAVANGIVVQSNDAQSIAHPAVLAVWNPQTGALHRIGRAVGNAVESVIGAYTAPGAGDSLLAWVPANCRFSLDCPIRITNTGSMSSRTLRSPLGHGFVLGGAFSPDGSQLAVFVNASPGAGGQAADLAIVSTGSGSVRLVRRVRMTVGEDTDWVRWLPGGTRLVVLANRDYLVGAATLTVRPFRFTGRGLDVDFSAVLIPPRG